MSNISSRGGRPYPPANKRECRTRADRVVRPYKVCHNPPLLQKLHKIQIYPLTRENVQKRVNHKVIALLLAIKEHQNHRYEQQILRRKKT